MCIFCCFTGIVIESLNRTGIIITPNLLRVVRVFRIGRLLRFFQKAKGIQRLIFSLLISLSALFNVGAILFLIMFIYAIIGMSFFGYVKKTGALNDVVNFETFLNSMLLIFRLMTAAGWNDVLDPLMIEPPDCDPDYKDLSNGNCGNYWAAVIYFYSFIIIIFLVLINMYVAVILENYNNVMEQEKVGITEDDIDLFYEQWILYDPDSTQYIYYGDLSDFLHTLEGNLGIKKPNKAACALLNIPLYEDDKIYCLHLLQALVRKVVSGYEEFDSDEFKVVLKRMEEKFRAVFPSVTHYRQTNTTLVKIRQIRAAQVITGAVRRYRVRKQREALGLSQGSGEKLREAAKENHAFDGKTAIRRGKMGSRIADMLVHGNTLSDSLPNLNRTVDNKEKRGSLSQIMGISHGSTETTRTLNRSLKEPGKHAVSSGKSGSHFDVVDDKSLSDSVPNLSKRGHEKDKLALQAWKREAIPRTPTLNRPLVHDRLAVLRQQKPRSAPLKKIKILEQPKIHKADP